MEQSGGYSLAQRCEKVAEFFVHLFGAAYGVSNFAPEQFAEAAAQAMQGHSHSAFIHFKASGGLLIESSINSPGETRFQFVEQFRFFRVRILLTQSSKNLLDEGQGPTALEEFFRRHSLGGFILVQFFGRQGIPGDDLAAAASFKGLLAAPIIIQEINQGTEKEGAK